MIRYALFNGKKIVAKRCVKRLWNHARFGADVLGL